MSRVFVSHAHDDVALVEAFTLLILEKGCGFQEGDLFVSSLPEHGASDGFDLLGQVRDKVEKASMVIAVITPTYHTRPVCVAELGGAWGVSGKLFPLLAPGVEREALDGC